MTMASCYETTGRVTHAMWVEAGVQFRGNLLPQDATLTLHAHSFDHVMLVTHGWVEVTEQPLDGPVRVYQLASKDFRPVRQDRPFTPVGYRVLMPKYHQHGFTVLECHDQPAEILCLYPAVADDGSGGC